MLDLDEFDQGSFKLIKLEYYSWVWVLPGALTFMPIQKKADVEMLAPSSLDMRPTSSGYNCEANTKVTKECHTLNGWNVRLMPPQKD